jgi:predicted deacylase
MTNTPSTNPRPTADEYPRVIGRMRAQAPGPTVISIGGMHGNEPSGVIALRQLVERMEKEQLLRSGEFIALTGNIGALQEGKRYIDRDLNRMWKFNQDYTELAPVAHCYEAKEMAALNSVINQAIEERRGPLIFLDLHTTSAISPPFVLIGDTLRNRKFVRNLGLPVILGLEEQLNGPFLSYLNTLGHISIGFEAGQHNDPVSVDNHYSLLMLVLAKAGLISARDIKDYDVNHSWLDSQTDKELKTFFEVRYRKSVHEGEGFKMEPGYHNFQPIVNREVLAHNDGGKIRAREKGRIFMPLYQSQGDDGFFIVRKIPPFWLRVSAILRRLKTQHVMRLLPGISRYERDSDMLVVNTRVVRWFGTQFLHLMGYRKRSHHDGKLLFIKREYDLKGPESVDEFQT